MPLTLVTGPEAVPISLAELKAQVRLTSDAGELEDALLAAYARAATSWAEQFLGKQLISATYDYVLDDGFPCGNRPYGSIVVPLGPVQSVTSITYTDTAGNAQTLAPSAYELSGDRIRPVYGTYWPSARPGITVRFVAGYGPTWNDIPEAIRQGIAMAASFWFVQREGASIGPDSGPVSDVPFGPRELLMPFRTWSV